MRIHINNPEAFAYNGGKVVIKLNTVNHRSLVRDHLGDYKTVKESSLKGITLDELKEELMSDATLRDVALSDELIEVGDYHNDDNSYMNYMSSYS
jgi:hypothetical protein